MQVPADLVARKLGGAELDRFQRAHEGGGHASSTFSWVSLATMMTSDFPFTAGATR